jgi:hypothetical protein
LRLNLLLTRATPERRLLRLWLPLRLCLRSRLGLSLHSLRPATILRLHWLRLGLLLYLRLCLLATRTTLERTLLRLRLWLSRNRSLWLNPILRLSLHAIRYTPVLRLYLLTLGLLLHLRSSAVLPESTLLLSIPRREVLPRQLRRHPVVCCNRPRIHGHGRSASVLVEELLPVLA